MPTPPATRSTNCATTGSFWRGSSRRKRKKMWIMKYWKPLAIAALLAAVVGGEYWYGRQRYQAGYDAATAAITAKMLEQHQQHQKTARAASVEYQQAKSEADEKVRVQREVVQKIIERPVYIDDCTDASGVSVLNAAIAERR